MDIDIKPGPVQTILMVEDEVLIRFHIADYLRDCGFVVIEAADAAEALTVLQSDEQVDLVLTDIDMPGAMNGIGLGQWLREHRPNVELVINSGSLQLAKEATELCKGHPLLQKPFAEADLLSRIRMLLDKAPPKPLMSIGAVTGETDSPSALASGDK